MTRTKLQMTGRGAPYVSFSGSIIEEGFKWKKGQKVKVTYDEIKKQIVVSQHNGEPRKNTRSLQASTPQSTPYIYLSKKIIATDFGWSRGQRLNVDHDVGKKRIVISEIKEGMQDDQEGQ